MNWTKTLTLSSAALAATLTYAQPVYADDMTGRKFSTLSLSAQDSYINISTVMASFIAGQIDPLFSTCINDWYYEDPRGQDAKNANLRSVITQYADYHPSATLMALMQKACGNFSR